MLPLEPLWIGGGVLAVFVVVCAFFWAVSDFLARDRQRSTGLNIAMNPTPNEKLLDLTDKEVNALKRAYLADLAGSFLPYYSYIGSELIKRGLVHPFSNPNGQPGPYSCSFVDGYKITPKGRRLLEGAYHYESSMRESRNAVAASESIGRAGLSIRG